MGLKLFRLRHAMTLTQEAEIKLKKYEGLNDDDPSVLHVTTTSQLDSNMMAIQAQGIQAGNPNPNASLSRPLESNLNCYICGERDI